MSLLHFPVVIQSTSVWLLAPNRSTENTFFKITNNLCQLPWDSNDMCRFRKIILSLSRVLNPKDHPLLFRSVLPLTVIYIILWNYFFSLFLPLSPLSPVLSFPLAVNLYLSKAFGYFIDSDPLLEMLDEGIFLASFLALCSLS